VDDDRPLQDLLKCSLEAFGLRVVGIANNGLEACEIFPQLKPDAVVMDIRMPVMDGIATLKRLKEMEKDCMVLMITALHEDDQRQQALDLGAAGFLHKPFRVDELFRDIQKSFRSLLARRGEAQLDEHYLRYVVGEAPASASTPDAAAGAGLSPPRPPSIGDTINERLVPPPPPPSPMPADPDPPRPAPTPRESVAARPPERPPGSDPAGAMPGSGPILAQPIAPSRGGRRGHSDLSPAEELRKLRHENDELRDELESIRGTCERLAARIAELRSRMDR
jgi:two-component system chemotaxis response regulator CheY